MSSVQRSGESPDAVAFWRPDAALAPYVSGYHRYVIGGAPLRTIDDVFFPAWTNLRFTLAAEQPWTVKFSRRLPVTVPEAALFGPTSCAGYVRAGRGTLVGVGVTPVGWARLFGSDLSAHADRITPLGIVAPDAADAQARLVAGEEPAAVFDAWLLARLATAPPENPAVARVFEALADPSIVTALALAERTGLQPRQLLRTARRAFGFSPKLLLRRARFVRALMSAAAQGRGAWHDATAAAGYWDHSHFLRDCRLFLDTTMSKFMAMERPLNRASALARTATLGQPMQSMTVPLSVQSSSP